MRALPGFIRHRATTKPVGCPSVWKSLLLCEADEWDNRLVGTVSKRTEFFSGKQTFRMIIEYHLDDSLAKGFRRCLAFWSYNCASFRHTKYHRQSTNTGRERLLRIAKAFPSPEHSLIFLMRRPFHVRTQPCIWSCPAGASAFQQGRGRATNNTSGDARGSVRTPMCCQSDPR